MYVEGIPFFRDEEAAYRFVESQIWPHGPVCPHCKGTGHIGAMHGRSTRMGMYKCYECRKPFTVKIGTIFEASNVPMHKWLQAIFLLSGDAPPARSGRLHYALNVAPRTATYMAERINAATRDAGEATRRGTGRTAGLAASG